MAEQLRRYSPRDWRSYPFHLETGMHNSFGTQLAMKFVILLLIAASGAYGQQSTGLPKYEVASIKPTPNDRLDYAFHFEPNGATEASGITLTRLMMTAYGVQGFRIVGGPDWVDSRRWDFQAKPDRVPAPPQFSAMLRALLEDRFQLRTHTETRRLPVYELTIDRKGLKLPVAKGGEPEIQASAGSIHFTNTPPEGIVGQLSYALGTVVIDKTGLSGRFDFDLRWTPQPGEDGGPSTSGLPPAVREQASPISDGPSIFTAIRDQLGLQLKAARGPVNVLVIDRVQLPTAN